MKPARQWQSKSPRYSKCVHINMFAMDYSNIQNVKDQGYLSKLLKRIIETHDTADQARERMIERSTK